MKRGKTLIWLWNISNKQVGVGLLVLVFWGGGGLGRATAVYCESDNSLNKSRGTSNE